MSGFSSLAFGPRLISICAAVFLPAQLVSAQDCPQAPDHSASFEMLFQQIQAAETERAARLISNQMWELWAQAPNEQAQAVLDRGMSRRSGYDLTGALEDFDRLTAYCPLYAEGYNQRAFVHFLRQDFAAALVDLNLTLELSPQHVAAMSGRALSLLGLSRTDEARAALQAALALNPWLPERGLAAPGGPLAPNVTKDIDL
ncbi:tetratricopeptide repeat protein [Parasedimentitalea huanghaiensis]|uniref:tetratricopeptide repeat protein n=1 Tax=Parasedimentitalea huanghaiensis TaxID=2682100 RepID=UPI003CC91076